MPVGHGHSWSAAILVSIKSVINSKR
jgi:hypothetical protein